MKFLFMTLLFFLINSCATNKSLIKPDLTTVKANKTGALLTIDLNTSGQIKRGKQCLLYLQKDDQQLALELKEGVYNYALPLGPGNIKLSELNCGPFYFYKLDDKGSWFTVKQGQISYLGNLDFLLDNKGQMTWGPHSKSERLLRGNLNEIGLEGDHVVIEPLKL